MEDNAYVAMLKYVTDKNYHEGTTESEKRRIRKQSKSFVSKDNLLYFQNVAEETKRVVRQSEKHRILRACHSDSTAGHFGRDKTESKIRERYYWAGIREDVIQHISKCDVCQRTNNPIKKKLPPLNSVPVPDTPWRQVGLDLIGPLPETESGFKYAATMTDYFSKWTEAKALKSKTAVEVVDFIFDTISTFGCMEIIITDQGREFVNELNDKLCELLKIKHKLTSPYHPQANGLDERFNQTFKRALEKLVNEKQNDWDVYIKHVLFAYRTSVNASTKYSPFYLMFGRQAKIPIELDLPSSADSEKETEDKFESYVDALIDIRQSVYSVANKNIKCAQDKQKRDYDRRNLVAEHGYKVGAKVLMKNRKNDHRMGGTLEKNWIGPYEIIEVMAKGALRLKNYSTEKVLKTAQHASNLKLYLDNQHDIDNEDGNTVEEANEGGYTVEEAFEGGNTMVEGSEGGNTVVDAATDDTRVLEAGKNTKSKRAPTRKKTNRLILDDKVKEIMEMIADKTAVQMLVENRKIITEQDIETIPSRLPGRVITTDLNEIRPYMEDDALLCLQSTIKMKLDDKEGAYNCPLCNKPSTTEVLGCDNCMEWYHLKCLGIRKVTNSDTWFCGFC